MPKKKDNNKASSKKAKSIAKADSQKIIDDLKSKIDDEKNKFLRLFAEFENYKKRTARERIELFSTASKDVLSSLLPVVDDFERALKDVNVENKSNSGFNLIYNKLIDIFKQQGLEVMDVKPKDIFDAELHEAVTQIPSSDDFSKGEIVDIISPGYKLGELIIRYPKVVVANWYEKRLLRSFGYR